MTRHIANVSASGNSFYPISSHIDAMLKLNRWDLPTSTATNDAITFSFPATTAHYPSFTQYISGLASHNFDLTGTDGTVFPSFAQATAAVQAVTRAVLTSQFSAVASMVFEERASGSSQAGGTAQNFYTDAASNYQNGVDLSISMANLTSGGSAFQPGGGRRAGDMWFDTTNGRFDDAPLGSNDYRVIMHEIGHALGLRHPHEGVAGSDLAPTVVMPLDRDTMEFSLMTYRMYEGAFPGVTDIPFSYPNSVETYGFAQSLMMLDIQALQYMYGANFGQQSGNTTYAFSPTTGEMSINGVGQGTPGANRVFRTVWDGNGIDTYDLSAYSTNLSIDLTPGGWSVFDQAQLAILNTADGTRARGNLFNALQYQGDTRSLIENATGGSGNDSMVGNAAANTLRGNGGSDTLNGGEGNDTIVATHADGNDSYTGGNGFDILDFSAVNGVVQINQLAGTVTGSAGNDTLVDVFEQIKGTSFNDVLSGGHGINVLDGEGGNDQFFGNNGDDLMRGGTGDDTFFFSTGDGNDILLGGDGFDILDYSTLGGVVQVNQLAGTTTGTANNDALSDIFEMVIGSAFGDVLSGGHGINSLKGNGGADQIFANNGDDYTSGGDGNDTITMGVGNDTHDFRNGEDVDTILDFTAGGSEDTITLTFYSGLGITNFTQLQASGRLSTVSGHAELALNGGDRIIFNNVASHTSLTAADFVFV